MRTTSVSSMSKAFVNSQLHESKDSQKSGWAFSVKKANSYYLRTTLSLALLLSRSTLVEGTVVGGWLPATLSLSSSSSNKSAS